MQWASRFVLPRWAGGVVAALGIAAVTNSAAKADLMFSLPALSHPNGAASADPLAVDDRDYGLRLDNGRVETFHFEDVTMSFFSEEGGGAGNTGTVYARLTGTIAHLQSSDNGVLGYVSDSGLDDLDQRWALEAEFRMIGREGGFGGGQDVPYPEMLVDLRDAGVGGGAITFALFDVTLTPLFDENVEPAVYTGPRVLDERPGSDDNPDSNAFFLKFRHRLTDDAFAGPEWDVIAAAGWLEPAPDQNNGGNTRDFLFYLNGVPSPTAAVLVAVALGLRRRAR